MTDEEMIEKQQEYLNQLKNYKAQGVRIIIDDRERPEIEWDRIFKLRDRSTDGSSEFYMSDIVSDDQGNIKEIRLDKFHIKGV